MKFTEYHNLFDTLLAEPRTDVYADDNYKTYTELNQKRQERWLKKGKLTEDTIETLSKITTIQKWTVISEPWCGDASHIVPFLHLMAEQSDKIELEIVLRDQPPFLIDKYLTNGGKAIPILIIQKEDTELVWGPRPAEAQNLVQQFKKDNVPIDEQKITLQKWYNSNKGIDIQQEIVDLLK